MVGACILVELAFVVVCWFCIVWVVVQKLFVGAMFVSDTLRVIVF